MEKPLTLTVKEIENQLVKVINESGLPPFILLNIIEGIQRQLLELDAQQVRDYIESKKNKKGSDK